MRLERHDESDVVDAWQKQRLHYVLHPPVVLKRAAPFDFDERQPILIVDEDGVGLDALQTLIALVVQEWDLGKALTGFEVPTSAKGASELDGCSGGRKMRFQFSGDRLRF